MAIGTNIEIAKISFGSTQIAKVSLGNTLIYSAGNTVTYYLDTENVYTEEVDADETVLSPKTFVPTKSGWEFIGWKKDTTANSDVLTNLTMGDDPITLYAVFRQTVTVTYYNGNTTKQTATGYKYYNNGNTVNPTFTIVQATLSGWTPRGWSTATTGNGAISYTSLSGTVIATSITLYSMYQQNITLTYYSTSATAATSTGVRYYNAGANTVVNPTFTITSPSISGLTFRGWSTGIAGNGSISYSALSGTALAANTTLYALFQQTVTVTYYNGTTIAASTSGTRYYSAVGGYINPTFTIAQAALSGWTARGWSTATTGNGAISYSSLSNTVITSNVTLYGMYYQTITLTVYNGGSTSVSSTPSGTRYYNSGSGAVVNPTFTISAIGLAGFSFRGWTTSTNASSTATIAYTAISNTAFASNTTLYAAYYQTITISFNSNGGTGTTNSLSGYRYYNGFGAWNPTFTLPTSGYSYSGYRFDGWLLNNSGNAYSVGSIYTATASVTFYAKWTYVGSPFYIIQGFICKQALNWSFSGSVTAKPSYASSFRVGDQYCNLSGTDGTGKSASIATNGNSTLYIHTDSDNLNRAFSVYNSNGTRLGYTGGDSLTVNVSGISSVYILVEFNSNWGDWQPDSIRLY